jgi:hypothetical protein
MGRVKDMQADYESGLIILLSIIAMLFISQHGLTLMARI